MLVVPRLLDDLVVASRWPRDSREAMGQNLKALVSPERVQTLAPEEQWLYLLPPPFSTVRRQSQGTRSGSRTWQPRKGSTSTWLWISATSAGGCRGRGVRRQRPVRDRGRA